MLKDYFKEMQQYDTLEIEGHGFIMYRQFGPEFHIGHFYVVPEKRRQNNSLFFGEKIEAKAKELGCTHLSCIVTISDKVAEKATRLVKIYINYGFQIVGLLNDQIVMKKDLI